MIFRDPWWLALLPVLLLAGWVWRGLQLQRPLRLAFLLLAVLLLAGPEWKRGTGGMDVWVLLDRSASTGSRIDEGLPEWKQLLERTKPQRGDALHWVDYAAEVVPQASNAGGAYTGGTQLTRTGRALEHVLAIREESRAARVLVFTDGYSTESLTDAGVKLVEAGVPLDFRLVGESAAGDFQVRRLQLPPQSQVSEPFLVEVEVTGPQDGPVPLTLFRNGQKMADHTVELRKGKGTARFTDRIGVSGAYAYEARISPAGDPHPGNNRFSRWITVSGGPRLLLVTSYNPDPLETVLKGQGFELETVRDAGTLRAGQLSGCRAVILNNVPAWEVPAGFLASLSFFVHSQGGGLLMAGGAKSFGAGGYFRSTVEDLLPVSLELKKDQKKLAAAMVIVMDRSGSMAAPVGGGTKMDLANEGTARSIDLLGYQDMVGVYAVDSEAHEVVPLQQIASDGNREEMSRKVRRVQSTGGGIFVYNGLKAAWKVLRDSPYGTRHIILFADAADAEQPEDYVRLLGEVTAEGGTVSVIALGTKSDADAAFLEDVARRGKGRIFFTDRAEDLPNVFTAETVAVARSAFISDPVPVQPTGLWSEISPKPQEWLPQVDGYNLQYRKDWASQALVSKDEFEAPLVAWGQRGSGRTAAISFPMGGANSEKTRAWPRYGDFAQTLARWLMGQPLPPGLGLRWEVKGTELALDLLYEGPEWEETFSRGAPQIALAAGDRAEPMPGLTWQRISPGFYRASVEMEEGSVVRGAIRAGTHIIPFGPLSLGTEAEWVFDSQRQEDLRQTSALSGGRELLNLAKVWERPPVEQWVTLRPWILLLLLLLLLADALTTRMGWKLPEFRPAGWWAAAGNFAGSLKGTPALPDRRTTSPPGQALRRSKYRSPQSPGVPAPPAPTPDKPYPVVHQRPSEPGASQPPPASANPATAAPEAADSLSGEERRRARFARAKKRNP